MSEAAGSGGPRPGERLAGAWYNPRVRAVVIQSLVFATLAAAIAFFVHNASTNMARVGIASGFGFLDRPANFAIGESLIAYDAADSYGRAILVGLINTIRIALLGCALTTILGTILGVLRLSSNTLLRGLVQAYVETMRNIPLLLHLFFWYAIIQIQLPSARMALNPLWGVYLSNRGVALPAIESQPGQGWVYLALALGVAGASLVSRIQLARRIRTGRRRRGWPWWLLLVIIWPAGLALALGVRFSIEAPSLRGFNFVGGVTLTPEFAALLIGLVLYTAAFVSEIVRGGILAVNSGQREAARSLGLGNGQTMRLIILPQALRVIIPPLTSTYLGLTKNSSLAVAIGYPDLVNVVNTTMNQTGQAVETVAILMGAYLALSLAISLVMNWYNSRVAIRER